MILVDTNVISEPLRIEPDPAVVAWLMRHPKETLFFSAIGVAELLRGAAILPTGRRKTELTNALDCEIRRLFDNRILSFDEAAARAYANIHGELREKGRAMGVPDSQIAAIARVRGFTVATRDAQPFRDAGVPVVNPWAEE